MTIDKCDAPADASLVVLTQAQRWLDEGQRVLLMTVTRTWGSAPRPVGAIAALCSDGRLAGSVSGGCIEDVLAEGFVDGSIGADRPCVREFGVDAQEAQRMGLPCGGTIQLVLEPLGPHSGLNALLAALQTHCLVQRTLDLASGEATVRPVTTDIGLSLTDGLFQSCLGRSHRLLLIGAGDLSQFVAQNAVMLGYHVTVCDPRLEYLNAWGVGAVSLTREMPDDVVMAMQPDARTAVIALSHDPKLDDLALMEALKTPAFYVAAIGSRKHHAARTERLRMFDLSDEQIAKLRGPAGLYIGALTPAEIGLSILAELTARRHGITPSAQVSVAQGKALQEHACGRPQQRYAHTAVSRVSTDACAL